MKGKIGQMDLVTGIYKLLDKHGIKTLEVFQMNDVIEAANLIMKSLDTKFVPAEPDSGIQKWLDSHDTGMSSLFMAYILTGKGRSENNHPHDPADFGRCYRLLQAVPIARLNFFKMQDQGPIWEGLIRAWSELEALWLEESPSNRCPKLYERMKEIIEGARVAK